MQGHLILYVLYIFLNNYTRYDTVQIMQSLLNFYIYYFFPFVVISGTFTFKNNLYLRKI